MGLCVFAFLCPAAGSNVCFIHLNTRLAAQIV